MRATRARNMSYISRYKSILGKALPAAMLALVFAGAAVAQDAAAARVGLREAVDRALENDPQTKVAAARIRRQTSVIEEVRKSRSPFVQVSQQVVRSNNPVFVFGSRLEQARFTANDFALDKLNKPDGMFNFRSLISVEKPLFDRRQTASRVKLAENGRTIAEFDSEIAAQRIRFNVIQVFYGNILAREMVGVTDEALKAADANRKKSKDMSDVGLTTEADYLAAEVQVASVAQQKLESESGLSINRAAFNIALGAKPEADFEIRGELTERFFAVEDQKELVAIALENRPEMKKAALAVASSREQSLMVRNQKLPQVGAFGNFGYSSPYIANGSTDYTVGINVTLTLFDAGRKARLAQAAEAETMASGEREMLANQITLEVIRASQNLRTAQAKIQVTVKSIAQAEEALRIVQDRYRFGLTTFNEVLRAEAAVVDSKYSLLAARYAYIVGYAQVLLATGRLTDVSAFD